MHFLKLAYSPARDPRFDWMESIIDARAILEDKLSPSLRRDVVGTLARLYGVARKQAALELQKYGERDAAGQLPGECPYTLEDILGEDWYPLPPDGPNGDAA